jgi:hypothetical protein
MRFRVGPWVYRVKIVEGLQLNGERVAGLCEWLTRTISIGAHVPVRQRLPVLLHELAHAYREAFGRAAASDDESHCDQAASFAADCWRQLERQGGEDALMRLRPDGVVDRAADVEEPGEPRAAQCPTCGGLLDMPIRTGPAEFDPARNRLVCRRGANCEFCGKTVTWRETVTSRGVPTGTVIGEPETTKVMQ